MHLHSIYCILTSRFCCDVYRESDELERDKQHDVLLELYRNILAFIPGFKKTIEDLGASDDFHSVMDLIRLVRPNFNSCFLTDYHIDG